MTIFTKVLAVVLTVGVASAQAAPADPMWTAEDQAFAQASESKGGVGLFQPLIYGLNERVDLLGPSVISLAAPRLGAKFALVDTGRVGVAVQGRVQVPAPGLLLGKGWILPSNTKVGLPVIAGLGVMVGLRGKTTYTSLGLEGRVGMGIGSDFDKTDMFFLDTVMAPITEGPRARLRLQFDYFPGLHEAYFDGTGLRIQASAHVGGLGPDLDAKVFGLWRVSKHTILGIGGAVAWEQLTHERALSFAPMLDVQYRF